MLPNKLYRYTGDKWIELPKTRTTSYLGNKEYIEHLVQDLNSGRISLEQLTEDEREEIANLVEEK